MINWDAAGVFAEIVGAAAVVVSLGYLAIQIRHSATINRATIRTQLTERSAKAIEFYAERSEIVRKVSESEPLTDTERIELSAVHRIFFRGFENYCYQRNSGLFEDSEWDGMLETIRASMTNEYAHEDWRAYRLQYSPPLRAIIDPLVPNYDNLSQTPEHNFATRGKANLQNSTR